jgi:hypothetical protein
LRVKVFVTSMIAYIQIRIESDDKTTFETDFDILQVYVNDDPQGTRLYMKQLTGKIELSIC